MNSRIINALRKKNWLLKGKFDSMKKKGGASVRRLLDQWKSTTYAFTLCVLSRVGQSLFTARE